MHNGLRLGNRHIAVQSNPTGVTCSAEPAARRRCLPDGTMAHAIGHLEGPVLEALATLPVSVWSYLADGEAVRHLGPMAEDFQAAFGMGSSDKVINSLDGHGVAFAAIQGLYQLAQEQAATIAAQGAELAARREQVAALERQVAAQATRQEALEVRLATLERKLGEEAAH
jgi:hypothetical protein